MTYIRLSISSFFSELSNKDTEKKKRFKLFYCNKGENDGQWMIGDVRMMVSGRPGLYETYVETYSKFWSSKNIPIFE